MCSAPSCSMRQALARASQLPTTHNALQVFSTDERVWASVHQTELPANELCKRLLFTITVTFCTLLSDKCYSSTLGSSARSSTKNHTQLPLPLNFTGYKIRPHDVKLVEVKFTAAQNPKTLLCRLHHVFCCHRRCRSVVVSHAATLCKNG